ncbi:catechol 2,3-dioxygenase [Paenibacillus shirakamiensis]|uniref:Catechol 2,3-dioxygenase n=1 Tax=Paenibacillus shirakamiensis TaxID=1265935 RepID=A0ABS4JL48_9BACL|nr:VOC family protein [Paenibacillus shirakamiensis]MBP2002413.1 catechol 2,3-dioxygenase [Paenibacillus shirakamiensis]
MTIIHPQTTLGVVQLRVSDLETSTIFYTEVIGLNILHQSDYKVELTVDGEHSIVILSELTKGTVLPQRSGAGLYHFAILVPDRASLGLVVRNLVKHNIPVGQGDHLVSEALYISDPDNNGIEIYRDRPRDTWTRDEQGLIVMTTDPVDVEGLLAASEGLTWSGLPEGTVIGHVHFHVADLNQAEAFYVGVLGFEIVARYGDSALFISAGGYHHHIGLNTWAGVGASPVPENAAGLDFYEIIVPSRQELDVVVGRLRASGTEVHDGDDGVYYAKDPFNIKAKLSVA